MIAGDEKTHPQKNTLFFSSVHHSFSANYFLASKTNDSPETSPTLLWETAKAVVKGEDSLILYTQERKKNRTKTETLT